MNNLSFDYEKIIGTPTIIFLHGWGLNRNSFKNIIARLENRFSILNIDLFGFGKSSDPQDYFDTYEYAYQIFLLLKRLGIEKVIIIGHSFGGRLSILLSSVFEVGVQSCFLCGSAGLNKFSLTKWFKIKKYKLFKRLVSLKLMNSSRLNRFGSNDYKRASVSLRCVMSRVVGQDLRLFAKSMMCKVVLVWDKRDTETPYWMCKLFKKIIPNNEVILYNNGGHFAIFSNVNKFSCLIKAQR